MNAFSTKLPEKIRSLVGLSKFDKKVYAIMSGIRRSLNFPEKPLKRIRKAKRQLRSTAVTNERLNEEVAGSERENAAGRSEDNFRGFTLKELGDIMCMSPDRMDQADFGSVIYGTDTKSTPKSS